MSVQIARKVALAYWGFSKKASSRAKSGVDIDIIKGNGSGGLETATAPMKNFATIVEKAWTDYTGQVGGYGRIPFEKLVDFAAQARSDNEAIGKSNLEEVQKWSQVLINEYPSYFVARAKEKKGTMELLVNTKN